MESQALTVDAPEVAEINMVNAYFLFVDVPVTN